MTIENHTGTGFADAAVKLLAGEARLDPRQIQWSYGYQYYKQMTQLAPTSEKGKDPSQAFGEYRMYRLPEATTVNNNQIKQVELITAAKVPVEKTYLYDGAKLQWTRYGPYFGPGLRARGEQEGQRDAGVREPGRPAPGHRAAQGEVPRLQGRRRQVAGVHRRGR